MKPMEDSTSQSCLDMVEKIASAKALGGVHDEKNADKLWRYYISNGRELHSLNVPFLDGLALFRLKYNSFAILLYYVTLWRYNEAISQLLLFS